MGQGVGKVAVEKDKQILFGAGEGQPDGPAFSAVFVQPHDRGSFESPKTSSESLGRAVPGAVIDHNGAAVAMFGQKRPNCFTDSARLMGLVVDWQHQKQRGFFQSLG
jgi:hypothetical protein